MQKKGILIVFARKTKKKGAYMKWEIPKLISLSDWQAHGDCALGSGELAGNCRTGPIAGGNICQAGVSAAVNCKAGDQGVPPDCTSGGTYY